MKCQACGYDRHMEYDGKKNVYTNEEPFINIIGTFYVTRETNYSGKVDFQVQLYACPKCKTVILDD